MKPLRSDRQPTYPRRIGALVRSLLQVAALAGSLVPGIIFAQGHGVPILPPIFIVQPLDQTVQPGQTATFTVVVGAFGGTGAVTYQWQRVAAGSTTTENLADSGNFSGTQTDTLRISNVTTAMSGDQFQCFARNETTLTMTSSAAVLTVPAVNLTITSATTATANLGANFTYTITASGGPTGFGSSGLPSGLSLNSSTGVISGTPNLAGVTVVTISANNGSSYGSATLVITVVGATPLPTYSFSTLAGIVSLPTAKDGLGAAARFKNPSGITTDSAGNVFVADYGNNVIRKVTPAGDVGLYSGLPGIAGSVDDILSYARYNGPSGVAADSAGNLYVSDYNNNTIRKVGPPPNQTVTTLAGTAGTTGSVDATGAAARFNGPNGLALDAAGNLYVADYGNQTIRKITPAGVVSTLAGSAGVAGTTDGTGTAARFNGPNGLAIDRTTGNLYVADQGNHTIRRVTPAGVVTTLAGSAGTAGRVDGTGTAARFYAPAGLTIDSAGNLFVADLSNNTIRKVTAAGVVTTFVGAAGTIGSANGTGTAAQFYSPIGVATDSANNVYVTDFGNNTVRKVTAAGVVSTLAGLPRGASSADGIGAAAQFNGPSSMAVDAAGNIFVADTYNNLVRKITPGGIVTTLAGSSTNSGSADGIGAAARFNGPTSVAVDAAGNVYVADFGNHTIRKITSTGTVTTLCGAAGVSGSADGTGAAARFFNPFGVATDSAGNIYVADDYNYTIRKVTPGGTVTTLAGSAGNRGSVDATGSAARFGEVAGITVDAAGNVYVADFGNATLRKVSPIGAVTTLAGAAPFRGTTDGTGATARFDGIVAVAADSAGNVFVADQYNHIIRKVTATGIVTTIGGVAGSAGSVDGNGSAARFTLPAGIAVSPAGDLYISDSGNCTIRKGLAPTSTTGRLLNLAVLTTLAANERMTVGTALTGATTSSAPVLFRAAGPALTQLGLSGVLPDPAMTLNSTSVNPAVVVATNDNWGGGSILSLVFSQVGAFGYGNLASKDAALYQPALNAGNYTVEVRDAGNGTGSVIVEIYDATPSANYSTTATRLTNVSVIKNIGSSLTAGFVIGGAGGKTVLIRAVGPTLGTLFGLSGAMSDPQLALFSGQTVIASNDNWGTPANSAAASATQIASVASSVGAFALSNGSKDATLLITLLPGNYTAQVTGVGGASGVAIVEVYEVP